MHVAFVVHSTLPHHVIPTSGHLTFFFKKLSMVGLKYDIAAWDDPTVDWTKYSHAIFTFQIITLAT